MATSRITMAKVGTSACCALRSQASDIVQSIRNGSWYPIKCVVSLIRTCRTVVLKLNALFSAKYLPFVKSKPRVRQTTFELASVHRLLQTVPHMERELQISSLPSFSTSPPVSLIVPGTQGANKNERHLMFFLLLMFNLKAGRCSNQNGCLYDAQ